MKHVTYTAKLRSTQWFSVGWGRLPFTGGFGQYDKNEWIDWGNRNKNLEPVAIMPPDNHLVASDWPGGMLTITCESGQRVKVRIPTFKDVKGAGFVDENGRAFRHGFRVLWNGELEYQ